MKKCSKSKCAQILKKRVPIIQWLPHYNLMKLFQDIIAGITVGLTAIPQGIAYAIVAGLSPEYGLYSSLTGGFVYLIFGSCKDVTIGPTAILAAMVSKYVVTHSADFAVLAAFLAGVVELILGILHLGFLVEFISTPVISGFTTAAALQIASAQLKSFFALDGPSGNYFIQSVYNFVMNIKTAKLYDPLLATVTIILLFILQAIGLRCKSKENTYQKIMWFVSLARNAIVVVIGMIIAYILKVTTNSEPLVLIGDIASGFPTVSPPPFSTVSGNETFYFTDMLNILGAQSVVIPLVAILETVAIAKAFSDGAPLDATQELIAVGLCNIVGSFVRCMPITGSFTRTALNNASGVQTTAGGIFKGLVIILALGSLTSTFYFIPRASLAGLIMMAMYSMVNFRIMKKLWINSKLELFILLLTMIVSLCLGLEFGIVSGTLAEALLLLFRSSRPRIAVKSVKIGSQDVIVVNLIERVAYCAAEFVRRAVVKASKGDIEIVIVDGTELKNMDSTVATNLMDAITALKKNSKSVIFYNFSPEIKLLCLTLSPKYNENFVYASNYNECLDKAGLSINNIFTH